MKNQPSNQTVSTSPAPSRRGILKGGGLLLAALVSGLPLGELLAAPAKGARTGAPMKVGSAHDLRLWLEGRPLERGRDFALEDGQLRLLPPARACVGQRLRADYADGWGSHHRVGWLLG